MLAAQMLGAHNAAIECLRRAMIAGQSFESRDQNLKHVAKLLSIFARQIETLDKHRGKGQQKVTVEHVHIEAGGQAVVGNIEATQKSSRSNASSESVPKAVTYAPGETLEMPSPSKVPAKKRIS